MRAAKLAIAAGADGITAHLREDRRHIRDDDIARLKAEIDKPLNFEMAATDEMVASRSRRSRTPSAWCRRSAPSAPPKAGSTRSRQQAQLAPVVHELKHAGIRVSLFIGAAPAQIEAAAALGAPVIEIHTGAWCDALAEGRAAEAQAEWQLHPCRRRACARASAWKCMPATGSITARAETIAALPRDGRTQYRAFPDRRGGVRGPGRTVKFMRAAMDRGAQEGERMIIGLGSDIIDVRRIEQRDRAVRRAVSRPHLYAGRARQGRRRANRVETYAKRYAAKEACAKALGTGFRRGVFWRDMGVVNLPGGRPTMKLTGGALERLQAITPPGCEARIEVSLTDEGPTAQAIVIISAVPAELAGALG